MNLRFILTFVFASMLSGLWLAAQQKQDGQARGAQPQPTEKRIYKQVGDAKLELWIYKPAGWKATDQRGGIVFYHGGGWSKGGPAAFSRQCARLAERGMVAATVQYRLTSAEGVQVTDCVRDARSAFRWVTAHAAELGIDPQRIAAGGGSAGGHLAATLTTLDELDDPADDRSVAIHPACLVLFNPAVKLDFRPVDEERMKQALTVSPYHHLKAGQPPSIIFHGENDTTVPIQTVRDYAAKVCELGGKCELVAFPGASHSFFNREPAFSDTLKQVETYLEQQGLIQGTAAPGVPTTQIGAGS